MNHSHQLTYLRDKPANFKVHFTCDFYGLSIPAVSTTNYEFQLLHRFHPNAKSASAVGVLHHKQIFVQELPASLHHECGTAVFMTARYLLFSGIILRLVEACNFLANQPQMRPRLTAWLSG